MQRIKPEKEVASIQHSSANRPRSKDVKEVVRLVCARAQNPKEGPNTYSCNCGPCNPNASKLAESNKFKKEFKEQSWERIALTY